MAFVFRILLAFGKFAIFAIVICGIIIGIVWLINRLVQLVAEQLGYEVGDFFQWIRSKLPERKVKDGKKS